MILDRNQHGHYLNTVLPKQNKLLTYFVDKLPCFLCENANPFENDADGVELLVYER